MKKIFLGLMFLGVITSEAIAIEFMSGFATNNCENYDSTNHDAELPKKITIMDQISEDKKACIVGITKDSESPKRDYYYFQVKSAGILNIETSSPNNQKYHFKVSSSKNGGEYYSDKTAKSHNIDPITLKAGDKVYLFMKETGDEDDKYRIDFSFTKSESSSAEDGCLQLDTETSSAEMAVIPSLDSATDNVSVCIVGDSEDDNSDYYKFKVQTDGKLSISTSSPNHHNFYLRLGNSSDNDKYYKKKPAQIHEVTPLQLEKGEEIVVYLKETGNDKDKYKVNFTFTKDDTDVETIELKGTLRDFYDYSKNNTKNPDFENEARLPNGDLGDFAATTLVNDTLTNKKPTLKNGTVHVYNDDGTDLGTVHSITDADSFSQWFNDVDGINTPIPYSLTLKKHGDVYSYDSEDDPKGSTNGEYKGFFPLDNKLFDNENNPHNYHFTYEIHSHFTYKGGETFEFSGDDDVWVFIDNKLVIDVGGIHSPVVKDIKLAELNLEVGKTYDLDFFFAERHQTGSNLKITTNIDLTQGNVHTEPTNRPKGTCYATTDNKDKLYVYDKLDGGLSDPKVINLTKNLYAEGGAYRAVDGYIYQFTDDGDTDETYNKDKGKNSLYKIDIDTGVVTLVKKELVSSHVDAAEFYYDIETQKDIFYVIQGDQDEDEEKGIVWQPPYLHAFDPFDDWKELDGYPKELFKDDGHHLYPAGLAINPYNGDAYAMKDYSWSDHKKYIDENSKPTIYKLNLQTGIGTKIFSLPFIDAEGLAFADNGKLYTENESIGSDNKMHHKIFSISIEDETIISVTNSGTSGSSADIETFSCNAGVKQVPLIFTIDKKEIEIKEGDTNSADGTNGKDINITIKANKLLKEDISFSIKQEDGSATSSTDYKSFQITKIMHKGTNSLTFSSHSVIADTKIEENEDFIYKVTATKGEFEDGKNIVKITIIDDDSALGCQTTALLSKETYDLFDLDTINKTETKQADIFSNGNIKVNAMGYNPIDGYIWGYNQKSGDDGGTGRLVRIGKGVDKAYQSWEFEIDYNDNNFETLSGAVNVGDIDKNGQMYLLKKKDIDQNLSGETDLLYIIDLNNSSSDYLKVKKVKELRDMNRGEVGVGKGLDIVDWAFHPKNGKLYGLSKYEEHSGWKGNRLYEIDPSSYVVKTTIVKGADNTNSSHYEAFFDENGYFYAYGNKTGKTYRIDMTDSDNIAQEAILFTDVPTDSKGGDTARCSAAPMGEKPIVTLSVQDTKEGNSGVSDVNITIISDRVLDKDITISYTTSESSSTNKATKDTDFVLKTSETMTIAKGTKTISIPLVKGDKEIEKDELFNIFLESDDVMFLDSERGVDKNITVTATIIDDDFNTLDAYNSIQNSKRKITTQIVNESFNLNIVAINPDGDIIDFPEDMNDTKVKLLDMNSSECVKDVDELNTTGFIPLGSLPEHGALENSFTNSSALKRAKVQFWWKNKYGYQTACSSDDFAIRPKAFKIVAPTTYKAGKDLNISFLAVDKLDNNTTNYNEDRNATVKEKKPACKLDDSFKFSDINFTDGGVYFTKNYSEVGKIDINISEPIGHEFAIVDKNDTDDNQRLITKAATSISFTPAKFSLEWDYKNHNYSDTVNYTYYSNNPQAMGARLFSKIKVLNDKDKVLENYVSECYATKPTTFKFTLNAFNPSGQNIKARFKDINDTFNNISPKPIIPGDMNISYTIDTTKFIKGERNETIALNFDRKTNIAYAPLRLEVKSVHVDDGDINKTVIDPKISTFIYARAHVQNDIEVIGDELNATIDYEVYLPAGINPVDYNLAANLPHGKDSVDKWYILPSTDASLDIGLFPRLRYPNAKTDVTKESSTRIKIKAEKLPNKNRVLYRPETFLMYNENKPDANNIDHDFTYKLLSPVNTWSGKGKEGKIFDDRASKRTIKRLDW